MNTLDIDYEQQQIQQIIQTQIKQQHEKERKELLSVQQDEYKQALEKDLQTQAQTQQSQTQHSQTQAQKKPEPEPEFEEPSLEEVRRVRLLRFEKTESKQLKQ